MNTLILIKLWFLIIRNIKFISKLIYKSISKQHLTHKQWLQNSTFTYTGISTINKLILNKHGPIVVSSSLKHKVKKVYNSVGKEYLLFLLTGNKIGLNDNTEHIYHGTNMQNLTH